MASNPVLHTSKTITKPVSSRGLIDNDVDDGFITYSYIKRKQNGTGRRGKIVSLLGISRNDGGDNSGPDMNRLTLHYTLFSVFLAYKELQTKSGRILPHLPELLEGCDMDWEYEARDTNYLPLQAVEQLLAVTGMETEAEYESITGHQSASELFLQEEQWDGAEWVVLLEQHGDEAEGEAVAQTIDQSQQQQQQQQQQLPLDDANGSGGETKPTVDQPSNDGGNGGLKRRRRSRRRRAREVNDSNPPRRRRLGGDDDELPLNAFGMIGDFSSRVSDTLSVLGNALSVPQLSGSSTSADLNYAPLFARTINTDDGKAQAFVRYMNHLNITHVANIYVNDPYGNAFSQSLVKYADSANISIRTISYKIGQEMETINNLVDSQYRVVIAIIIDFEHLVKAAYQRGVMGVPHYVWYMAEKFLLTSPTYEVFDPDVAHALNGIGLINVYQKIHPRLDDAMNEFVNSNTINSSRTPLQMEFIASHAHPEIYDNYTFVPHASTNAYQYMFFDAMIALGLASCRTPGSFTGNQLFQQLLQLEFEGVTGLVSFDEWGNRRAFSGLEYRIDNIRLRKGNPPPPPPKTMTNLSSHDTSSSEMPVSYRFDSRFTTILAGNVIQTVDAFLYNDYGDPYQFTTTHPFDLPPVQENYNFIPSWAKGLGLALGSSIMVLSLLLMAWTWRRRTSHVIKAAQPPFLIQLCFGTLVYSAAIYPRSLARGGPDEGSNPWKYNIACMSSLWLLFIGFVISFSAILAKTLRLNKIMNKGSKIRRVKIKAKDVMKPFFTLMTINVVGLLGITFVAPFQFQRNYLEHNQDTFGRTVESYGTCVASSDLFWAFLVPMATANSVGVIWAIWQCYIARDLPMDFSETHYLAMSMFILVETIIISSPMLFALKTQPTAYFLFSTIAICFLCLSMLVPVFLPKWIHRRRKQNLGRAQANLIATKTRNRRRGALYNASTISGLGKNTNASSLARSGTISGFGNPSTFRSTISGLGSPSTTLNPRVVMGSSSFPEAVAEEASRDGSALAVSDASNGMMIFRRRK